MRNLVYVIFSQTYIKKISRFNTNFPELYEHILTLRSCSNYNCPVRGRKKRQQKRRNLRSCSEACLFAKKMNRIPKYQQIMDWIHKRIESGELRVGDRLETEAELSSLSPEEAGLVYSRSEQLHRISLHQAGPAKRFFLLGIGIL